MDNEQASDPRDVALKAAKDRYLAELAKHAAQRETLTDAALSGFLAGIAERKEEQSDMLQEHCAEAVQHIRSFEETTTSMTTQLGHLSMSWLGLVNQGTLHLMARGLSIQSGSPAPGESPRAAVQRMFAGIENTLENVKRGGVEVDAVMTATAVRFCAAMDGASGVIVMRRNTLEGFRRSHVMSSWEQIRTSLVDDLGEELSETFADEIKDQVVDELIKRGGELGAWVAEQIPVFGAAGKLVYVFYKAMRPPEKFNKIGGGDILLSLLSALRREDRIHKALDDELRQTFESVSDAIRKLA